MKARKAGRSDNAREATGNDAEMGEGCPLHWFDADLGAFDDLERRVAEHPADFFAGQDFDPVGACATR